MADAVFFLAWILAGLAAYNMFFAFKPILHLTMMNSISGKSFPTVGGPFGPPTTSRDLCRALAPPSLRARPPTARASGPVTWLGDVKLALGYHLDGLCGGFTFKVTKPSNKAHPILLHEWGTMVYLLLTPPCVLGGAGDFT